MHRVGQSILAIRQLYQVQYLTYLKEYSVRQNILYKLIRHLYQEKEMGYRKISNWLNRSGILSERGRKFSNSLVCSILKRKKERDMRISNIRKKKYDFILKDMRVVYINHSQISKNNLKIVTNWVSNRYKQICNELNVSRNMVSPTSKFVMFR